MGLYRCLKWWMSKKQTDILLQSLLISFHPEYIPGIPLGNLFTKISLGKQCIAGDHMIGYSNMLEYVWSDNQFFAFGISSFFKQHTLGNMRKCCDKTQTCSMNLFPIQCNPFTF